MSETTKVNKKRLIDDWEEEYHTPTENMEPGEKKNKLWKKTYSKLEPSIKDIDEQEKEDDRKDKLRFSGLKKLLRGE